MPASKEIFATRADMLALLQGVEARQPLQYAVTGLFERPTVQRYEHAQDIENLGISLNGDINQDLSLMAMKREEQVHVETVPQDRGGIRYSIDTVLNPDSVIIHVGGEHGSDVIITGQISTLGETVGACELMKLFSKEIRRQFERIDVYHVGPGAAAALDAGARLACSLQSPRECDLHR